MKLLLKILLQRRARDEGFTLPMVIAIGLVMLLLGAISITTANEENLTAITQNSRSDALAVAEVGVARYRELLDRNRILAIYDERDPITTGPTGTTDPTGTNATQTRLWGRTEVCSGDLANFRKGATAQTIVDIRDIDNDGDTTDIIGSYSLVSYNYINNDTTTLDINKNGVFNLTDDTINRDAIGRLTVKGTASDGSEAQIQVDIPIRINLDDMTNLAPALWIGNSGITAANLVNLTIGNGNVVIRDQASADGCNVFIALNSTTTTPPRTVIGDSRDLPLITKIITNKDAAKTILTTQRTAATPAKANPNTINPLPTVSSGQMIFGTTSHDPFNPDANNTNCSNLKLCRYYYEFGSTTSDLTSNPTLSTLTSTVEDTDLLTDGIARTTLVLNQSLTINASGRNVKIGSTSPVANDSNSFEIYVSDNDLDPTNGSTNNITIDAGTGRTVTINGFIHAPQSKLTITGNGSVNINGSVWVNDFEKSSGSTVNISPDTITREPSPDNPATSGKGYEFYSTTARRTPRPITGSPTNWKTEQVN